MYDAHNTSPQSTRCYHTFTCLQDYSYFFPHAAFRMNSLMLICPYARLRTWLATPAGGAIGAGTHRILGRLEEPRVVPRGEAAADTGLPTRR